MKMYCMRLDKGEQWMRMGCMGMETQHINHNIEM